MYQKGFGLIFIILAFFVIFGLMAALFLVIKNNPFINSTETKISKTLNTLTDADLEATPEAKIDETAFLPKEILNKDEKAYWNKFFSGEEVRDVSAFTIPHPASESAQKVSENVYSKKYHAAKLSVKDFLPKNASSEAYLKTAFFIGHFQLISPKTQTDSTKGSVYLEYFERADYPVDTLLAYDASLNGLDPNTKYQLMLCQYALDCYPEVNQYLKDIDQYQERFFIADSSGSAQLKGLFSLNSLADRMVVVKYADKYNYNSTTCGSIKLPCLITSLPKVLRTVHPGSYSYRKLYSNSYKNPDNLKKAIKNMYLPYSKDVTFQDSKHKKIEYVKNLQDGVLNQSSEHEISAVEAKSCEEGLSVFVDKDFGDLLGFKLISCKE